MTPSRRTSAAATRSRKPSSSSASPRRTTAGLQGELHAVRAELSRVDRQNLQLRRWSSDVRRIMALAALVFLMYAIVFWSEAARAPR